MIGLRTGNHDITILRGINYQLWLPVIQMNTDTIFVYQLLIGGTLTSQNSQDLQIKSNCVFWQSFFILSEYVFQIEFSFERFFKTLMTSKFLLR